MSENHLEKLLHLLDDLDKKKEGKATESTEEQPASKAKKTSPKTEKLVAKTPEDPNYKSIKSWTEEDRPREKLMIKGRQMLTNAELIAILIGSGSVNESAVTLAMRILNSLDNDLNELGKLSVNDLTKFKGMGEAKAITIVAALELGRRRQLMDIRNRPQIRSSADAYDAIAPIITDLKHEEFWILLLNRSNQVLQRIQISSGGTAGTVVDPKIIFKRALELPASGMILFHNHPSGSLQPSQADVNITKKLKAAGDFLEISVLDHLIISEKGYFSFADEGMM